VAMRLQLRLLQNPEGTGHQAVEKTECERFKESVYRFLKSVRDVKYLSEKVCMKFEQSVH
jgi:hypothetical protein